MFVKQHESPQLKYRFNSLARIPNETAIFCSSIKQNRTLGSRDAMWPAAHQIIQTAWVASYEFYSR